MNRNNAKRLFKGRSYTQAVLKFLKRNTQASHREAAVQGRSLPPIPASVYRPYCLV
ncbi:MAG: hypothetical protein LBJ00_09750 [Planctomycetaceae bacterium]|nr:hypothetical protein [Planctomycetaceae bacterium]